MATPLFDLAGKRALVTGGGTGIGRAIAAGLAEAGADVALSSRRADNLEASAALVRDHGRRALVVPTDLSQVANIAPAIGRVVAELGGLDILVNSAGNQITGPSLEVDEEAWDIQVDLMLKTTFFCAQAAARHFADNGGGKIINLASTFSVAGFPQFAAYTAAKGGVLNLTRTLAAEWAPLGINVNGIAPGATRTELNAYLLDNPDFREIFLPRFPAGTFCQPEDMVGAAVFLASRASDLVHGHTIFVDAGYTAI